LYSDIEEAPFVHTKKWLSLGDKAKSLATSSIAKGASHEQLLRLTERLSLIFQIENLLTYPYVKQGVEDGSIQIHAWLYDMESGDIEYYDPDESDFKPLTSSDKK
jgi:carbonic anhydrase